MYYMSNARPPKVNNSQTFETKVLRTKAAVNIDDSVQGTNNNNRRCIQW